MDPERDSLLNALLSNAASDIAAMDAASDGLSTAPCSVTIGKITCPGTHWWARVLKQRAPLPSNFSRPSQDFPTLVSACRGFCAESEELKVFW